MGKAMSNKIKSKAQSIINEFSDKLSVDFKKNKEFLKKMKIPLSKKTINLMSAYITRVKKNQLKKKKELEIKKEGSKNENKVPTKKLKEKNINKS